MTEPNIGLHGYELIFLKSVPEWEIYKGEGFCESFDNDAEAQDTEHYYFDTYKGHQKVKRSDEGKLYARKYFELRANWLNTEYTPARMSDYRLTYKRQHAVDKPDGRTAELMGHIDVLQQELDKMTKALKVAEDRIADLRQELDDCNDALMDFEFSI